MNTVVVGAGFAGLSTAYHLAKSGVQDVLVIEQEKKLGRHASGNNAGMIRQTTSDLYLAILAREGRDSLERASRNGWADFRFESRGSLLLAKGEELKELKKIRKTITKIGLHSRELSPKEAAKRVSILEGGNFKKALFCPSDASVEIRLLLGSFLERLDSLGVKVLYGQRILKIRKIPNSFLIDTSGRKLFAERVVNAAGAWAGRVGEKAGAVRIPFKAYRRHLFLSSGFKALKKDWPFVWDLSHNFYFRPKGRRLLLSPCDRVFVDTRRESSRREKKDPGMKKILAVKLKSFSEKFRPLNIGKSASGLRTMVPDGRFVIGEDPKLKGFFWVAGLGGHGVTTSFSVGRLASDLILGRIKEGPLERALSPRRFVRG